MNTLRCGDIRIVEVIYQPQASHFAFNGLDAGSPADQVYNLVCVQLPAHKLLKRDDFASPDIIAALFISPSSGRS